MTNREFVTALFCLGLFLAVVYALDAVDTGPVPSLPDTCTKITCLP
jgi:hypothetical protein